jgi:hypothetical protein
MGGSCIQLDPLKAYRLSELNFLFVLIVANIRCFILIKCSEQKSRFKKIPDSELIRESVCACVKLFVDEENVGCAKIESWKNKNINFLNYINSNTYFLRPRLFTYDIRKISSAISIKHRILATFNIKKIQFWQPVCQ